MIISEEILDYCEEHSTSETDVLYRLTRETNLTQVYPRMLAGPLQGLFLRMISSLLQPKKILEIGTFTGYSAICLASPMKDRSSSAGDEVALHTIEVNPEQEEIIRKYLSDAGLSNIVQLHTGDAMQIIPTLEEEWDLVYLDADKPHYADYYRLVLPRVRAGGFILADNALWDGKVVNPGPEDKDVRGIREFNDLVQRDERVENVLLPFRDGLMMIRKK